MNLNKLIDSSLRSSSYRTPAIELYIVEPEETLAKSNTEQIIDDGDDYDWND